MSPLNVVGQLFRVNNLGQININSLMSREEVRQEYVNISILLAAFDTIQHSVLMEKLKLYGASAKSLAWVKDYLTD